MFEKKEKTKKVTFPGISVWHYYNIKLICEEK